MYDEVYKDSQGREVPSVKIKVKNGNYRRQKHGFLTSGFNLATPFPEEHQPLQHPYNRSQPRLQLNSRQICKNEDCHLPRAG